MATILTGILAVAVKLGPVSETVARLRMHVGVQRAEMEGLWRGRKERRDAVCSRSQHGWDGFRLILAPLRLQVIKRARGKKVL